MDEKKALIELVKQLMAKSPKNVSNQSLRSRVEAEKDQDGL